MNVSNEIPTAMNEVSKIISQLISEGFLVNRVVIGNEQRPTIFLFYNSKCQELVDSGRAFYRYIIGCRIQQGFFERCGCRVVWSESLVN